jgi:tetratricopeptide (TPR) repeat protein
MSNVRGKIFCQRCKSANDLGEDLCGQCGTRLMLLVEPSAARFEGRGTNGGMEEHLLERVTAIENHISRVIDKLEKMAELMLKQSRSAYFDHELLDTLITVLTEAGSIDRHRLAALWRERRRKEGAETEDGTRFGRLRDSVLAAYDGEAKEPFARLVREGFDELEKERTAAGLRALERAAALAPDNAPLNATIGEQLFIKGKTAPARDYLSRAHAVAPESGRLLLLLGLVCGDEGETERARTLLREAVEISGHSFAAHCALGRLAAAESDWKGALAEFKLALAARPGPEAHYLLGLANFQLGRDRTAVRHLSKAVGLDEKYGVAFYLLGLALRRHGDSVSAARAWASADALGAFPPQVKDDFGKYVDPTPSLFEQKGRGRRRLVTGGDERLAAALRADALESRPAL